MGAVLLYALNIYLSYWLMKKAVPANGQAGKPGSNHRWGYQTRKMLGKGTQREKSTEITNTQLFPQVGERKRYQSRAS